MNTLKTVFALVLGFWISRQFYKNMDKKEAEKKEAYLKAKAKKALEKAGLNVSQAKKQVETIFQKQTEPNH